MLKALCLILISLTWVNCQQKDFNPPYYDQGDPRWANITLGFGPETIGQAGCLMTSVTSMAAGEGVLINNTVPIPPLMNEWLKENGGFVYGDDFVYASIDSLGFEFIGFLYNSADIIQNFEAGKRIIINVHEGRHFVLVTGINELGYTVMDPGYNLTTYMYQDVVKAVIYNFNGQSIEY